MAGVKVLVANRGEIACRVLRSLRELGIPSVAVYTDVDKDAPFVWLADEVVSLGDAKGYLDQARLLAAATTSGATAIHPGYGFLSESPTFARAVLAQGLTFIGPKPDTMEVFGDKHGARALALKNRVPVVPGSEVVETSEPAARVAGELGYPILLKAAAGGGGRGIRRVDEPAHLAEAFAAASREAQAAFTDGRLLVEKYVQRARHVEVQILGNGEDAVALGERECSLQRRYQKVIEESPSPGINAKLRKKLFTSALSLARAAGYRGAGTVEFLVGPAGDYYFLEVNARLQVEHPVTEMCTGLDLVAAQIAAVVEGTLPGAVEPRGVAIEARLCAEDAGRDFLPQSGRVAMLAWPQRPHLRVDAGIEEGSEVPPDYDSLLAKIIAWAPEREQARKRLVAALHETTLLGVPTNQAYLAAVLATDFFAAGNTFTTSLAGFTFAPPPLPDYAQLAAAEAARPAPQNGQGPADRYSPWQHLGAFRVGA